MEAAGRAPRFGHYPREAGLHGGGAVVEVVAVEAHAGLKAKTVSRAQAGQAERLGVLAQQVLRDGGGVLWGNRNLESVFAGVAAAADETGRGESTADKL